jgi:hypothetical protein
MSGITRRITRIQHCFTISPRREFGCEGERLDGEGHASERIGEGAARATCSHLATALFDRVGDMEADRSGKVMGRIELPTYGL